MSMEKASLEIFLNFVNFQVTQLENVSTTVSTIAESVLKMQSTTISSTEMGQVDQNKSWSGMEHAKQLVDQLTQMTTVMEGVMEDMETTTLSAVYQYPGVPGYHDSDMLHISLLHGSMQFAVWVILLVIIVLLVGE